MNSSCSDSVWYHIKLLKYVPHPDDTGLSGSRVGQVNLGLTWKPGLPGRDPLPRLLPLVSGGKLFGQSGGRSFKH